MRFISKVELAFLIGATVMVAVILGVGFMIVYTAVSYKEICIKTITVVEVGGCNQRGGCSYMDDEGNKGISELPVKGEKICVKTGLVRR